MLFMLWRLLPRGFWEWMYPPGGGEETVSEAALGVIILWFCWYELFPSSIHAMIDDSCPVGLPSTVAPQRVLKVRLPVSVSQLVITVIYIHL